MNTHTDKQTNTHLFVCMCVHLIKVTLLRAKRTQIIQGNVLATIKCCHLRKVLIFSNINTHMFAFIYIDEISNTTLGFTFFKRSMRKTYFKSASGLSVRNLLHRESFDLCCHLTNYCHNSYISPSSGWL